MQCLVSGNEWLDSLQCRIVPHYVNRDNGEPLWSSQGNKSQPSWDSLLGANWDPIWQNIYSLRSQKIEKYYFTGVVDKLSWAFLFIMFVSCANHCAVSRYNSGFWRDRRICPYSETNIVHRCYLPQGLKTIVKGENKKDIQVVDHDEYVDVCFEGSYVVWRQSKSSWSPWRWGLEPQ